MWKTSTSSSSAQQYHTPAAAIGNGGTSPIPMTRGHTGVLITVAVPQPTAAVALATAVTSSASFRNKVHPTTTTPSFRLTVAPSSPSMRHITFSRAS
jgi:hypothetical protein